MEYSMRIRGWDSLTKKPRIKVNYTKQCVEVLTPFGTICYNYKGKLVHPHDLVRDLIAYYTKMEKLSVAHMREEVRQIVKAHKEIT